MNVEDATTATVPMAEGGHVTADEARIIIAFDELTAARHEDDEVAEDAAAKRLADVLADVSGELVRLRTIVDLAVAMSAAPYRGKVYADAEEEFDAAVAAERSRHNG